MRRTGMRPLLVLVLLLLPGCAAGDDGERVVASPPSPVTSAPVDPAADGGIKRAENDLAVELDRGDGTPPERWSLTCVGFVAGDHPDAGAACEHLKQLEEPFAPLPADAVCTEIYGGPQTARVTGLWRGEPVDLELARSNGCRIDQWDSLGPLLPA